MPLTRPSGASYGVAAEEFRPGQDHISRRQGLFLAAARPLTRHESWRSDSRGMTAMLKKPLLIAAAVGLLLAELAHPRRMPASHSPVFGTCVSRLPTAGPGNRCPSRARRSTPSPCLSATARCTTRTSPVRRRGHPASASGARCMKAPTSLLSSFSQFDSTGRYPDRLDHRPSSPQAGGERQPLHLQGHGRVLRRERNPDIPGWMFRVDGNSLQITCNGDGDIGRPRRRRCM